MYSRYIDRNIFSVAQLLCSTIKYFWCWLQCRKSIQYCTKTTVSLHVSACILVVPGFADCQFPEYLWQSLSTTWLSKVHHGSGSGQEEKRWTSQTLYPPGDTINWTSRREIEVMRSQLTIKAVTKAVCLDSITNTSIVCDRKDILYSVFCLTTGLSGVYRVRIHSGGQVNTIRFVIIFSVSGFIKQYQKLLTLGQLLWNYLKTRGPVFLLRCIIDQYYHRLMMVMMMMMIVIIIIHTQVYCRSGSQRLD